MSSDALAPPVLPAFVVAPSIPENEIVQRRQALAGVQRFFGLDIHRDYLVATAVDHDLQIVFGPVRVGWERFEAWIAATLTLVDAVVVEMTTNTWQVHDQLAGRVHSVTVVHPPHVKLITDTPVMNDKKAAEALASLLATGLLRSVWVPDQITRDWRQLVAQRLDRVKAMTIAKNRLQSVLHRHQFEKPKASDPYTEPLRAFWLSLPVSPAEKLAVELDLETIAQSQAQLARIEAMMTAQVVTDARLPFLVQLPGVSVLGALTILAAIGPIERFASPKKLVGYAGLGTRLHDSGTTRWSGRITKAGRKDLRYVMVNAAQAAARSHPHWQAELARLEPRTGRNKAIIAIARKLLVGVWHILTKREADRFAEPEQVAKSFAQTAYGSIGAAELPEGETGPEFVRRNLDALKLGKDLQYVKYGNRRFILPQSGQPGAAPMAQPTGRGQLQNTREAKAKRAAEAARKRADLEAKRLEAEARMGRPRKQRADKGTKRGPNRITTGRPPAPTARTTSKSVTKTTAKAAAKTK